MDERNNTVEKNIGSNPDGESILPYSSSFSTVHTTAMCLLQGWPWNILVRVLSNKIKENEKKQCLNTVARFS